MHDTRPPDLGGETLERLKRTNTVLRRLAKVLANQRTIDSVLVELYDGVTAFSIRCEHGFCILHNRGLSVARSTVARRS
jgi:hypothetical protein